MKIGVPGTKTALELKQGDITEENVDAVVNAANSRLAGGGGVDGAIHRRGGPVIAEQCREIIKRIGRLETGRAVHTDAGDLPARYVIHTVGPIWRGGAAGEAELLASAYRSSLDVARELGVKTIAFPSISTGAYGYPVEEAAAVALKAVIDYVKQHPDLFDEVRFVLFDSRTFDAYRKALQELLGSSS